MKRFLLIVPLAALTASLPAAAGDPWEGNGGEAWITTTPAMVGGDVEVRIGHPGEPGGTGLLIFSTGAGPVDHPVFGEVGIDLFVRDVLRVTLPLDAAGEARLTGTIANNPLLVARPPLYASAWVPTGGGVDVSKTVRISWENSDGWNMVGELAQPRGFHTATALGADPSDARTRVLVAGGGGGDVLTPLASTSTELFDPIAREFVAGPDMSEERSLHAALRLSDGRVLIAGGMATGGVVTSGCEIYDPATGAMSPTGSMTAMRMGHSLTELADGTVLATGGVSDYVDAANDLITVLNTAQDTAELYDPATGTWSPLASAMSSPRSGHRQTTLDDGMVLITGGIDGAITSPFGFGQPTYTSSCDLFDPATGTFAPTAPLLTGVAFHGQSLLADGRVLVTGGTMNDGSFVGIAVTQICQAFDGANWLGTGSLDEPVVYHTQVPTNDGGALVVGGLSGDFPAYVTSTQTGSHDGTLYTPGADIGLNVGFPNFTRPQGRGAHTQTQLYDGTWLVVGGGGLEDGERSDAFVYTE